MDSQYNRRIFYFETFPHNQQRSKCSYQLEEPSPMNKCHAYTCKGSVVAKDSSESFILVSY